MWRLNTLVMRVSRGWGAVPILYCSWKETGPSVLCCVGRLPATPRQVQTKCDGSEEKQVILALGASIHHHTGHHFNYPGEGRSKRWLLN